MGGKLLKRAGKPVARPDGQPTPCHKCPKIPNDVAPRPWNAVELTVKNLRAIRFHEQCKAVGEFPDDPIVKRNAGLIESTLADIRDSQARAATDLLSGLVRLLVVKR